MSQLTPFVSARRLTICADRARRAEHGWTGRFTTVGAPAGKQIVSRRSRISTARVGTGRSRVGMRLELMGFVCALLEGHAAFGQTRFKNFFGALLESLCPCRPRVAWGARWRSAGGRVVCGRGDGRSAGAERWAGGWSSAPARGMGKGRRLWRSPCALVASPKPRGKACVGARAPRRRGWLARCGQAACVVGRAVRSGQAAAVGEGPFPQRGSCRRASVCRRRRFCAWRQTASPPLPCCLRGTLDVGAGLGGKEMVQGRSKRAVCALGLRAHCPPVH